MPGQPERSDLEAHNIHVFQINNVSLDTDRYLPPAPAPQWHVKKTTPPTELQIPATITTLILTQRSKQQNIQKTNYDMIQTWIFLQLLQ